MLKSFFRTSRQLIRRRINTSSAVNYCHFTILCKRSLQLQKPLVHRRFASHPDNSLPSKPVDPAVFEKVCSETLESLCDFFEELIEAHDNLKGADVKYSDGVLTVDLGKYGIYVINRQTPNKQIWLSSPVSGPKRYDINLNNGGYWIYKHDGVTLHKLLQIELSKIVNNEVDLKKCSHSVL